MGLAARHYRAGRIRDRMHLIVALYVEAQKDASDGGSRAELECDGKEFLGFLLNAEVCVEDRQVSDFAVLSQSFLTV